MCLTLQNEQLAARCVRRAGESDREAYESVGVAGLRCIFDLGYCHGDVPACMCICAICRCCKVMERRKEKKEGSKKIGEVGPLSLSLH